MASMEWAMRTPHGAVPYSAEQIAMEEVKSAKTEVAYANAGQTPPNTAVPKAAKVLGVAVQVWIVIIAGLIVAYVLFKHAHKGPGAVGKKED